MVVGHEFKPNIAKNEKDRFGIGPNPRGLDLVSKRLSR
jgi:hypothetical protein